MAKKETIQIRVDTELKEELTTKAKDLGFSNLSEFMLFVAKNAELKVTAKNN
jgi:antitoxin component of RelBE/YafQ-DinJ toxin-antitoxin module